MEFFQAVGRSVRNEKMPAATNAVNVTTTGLSNDRKREDWEAYAGSSKLLLAGFIVLIGRLLNGP